MKSRLVARSIITCGMPRRYQASSSSVQAQPGPGVFSLAFWGGVWGIALAWFLGTNKRNWYLRALIFGALLPTAVAMFVVAPLKGAAMGFGWDPQLILGGIILNGLWGLGTALIYRLLAR